MSLLSIVIPVYNNAESLEVLVTGIESALGKKQDHELILIDDGSSDNSWEILLQLIKYRKSSHPLLAIKLKKNYGQENAKIAGLKNAVGDYIVFMDADCQHDPEHIFLLLSECEKGNEICYANFSNSPVNIFKRTGSSFYNYLAYQLISKPKGIYLSSYNMMKKDIGDKVKEYEGLLVNIDAIALKHAKSVSQIFVEQRLSLNTKTNYTPLKLVALFFKLLPGFSVFPKIFLSLKKSKQFEIETRISSKYE
jgi:undecaprenyl-phosphate 4-deoxy-4-formamido-L-arabinose transferase